jgi:hypothetical protein
MQISTDPSASRNLYNFWIPSIKPDNLNIKQTEVKLGDPPGAYNPFYQQLNIIVYVIVGRAAGQIQRSYRKRTGYVWNVVLH